MKSHPPIQIASTYPLPCQTKVFNVTDVLNTFGCLYTRQHSAGNLEALQWVIQYIEYLFPDAAIADGHVQDSGLCGSWYVCYQSRERGWPVAFRSLLSSIIMENGPVVHRSKTGFVATVARQLFMICAKSTSAFVTAEDKMGFHGEERRRRYVCLFCLGLICFGCIFTS